MNKYAEKLRALKEKNNFSYSENEVPKVPKGSKEPISLIKVCSSDTFDTYDTLFSGNEKNNFQNKATDEEAALRRWLDHIEETDPDIIQCVLDQCSRDAEARTYFLEHAKQVNIEPQRDPLPGDSAICKTCKHFQRIDHPHMGRCLGGVRNPTVLLLDDDVRQCMEYEARIIEPGKKEGKQI
jgi:hypothetical protein